MDVSGTLMRLHRIVLAWDYFRLQGRAMEGLGVYDELQKIPKKFASLQEYKEVFEPMVLEEVGAQVLRGIEEGLVLEPNPAVVAACDLRDDFHYCRISLEPGVARRIMDNDMVLISKDNPMSEECRCQLHTLGFVEGHEGEQSLRIRFFLTDDSQAGSPEGISRVRVMRAALEQPYSQWWLMRLFNMSTISREWVALQHVHLMPFCDVLLSAVPTRRLAMTVMDIPRAMAAAMEAQCNGSQMAALRAGLDGTALVLIQGPPGTGKTRTILNMLSVVMHAAAHGSLELLPPSSASDDGRPGDGAGGAARESLWRLQSPWMFGRDSPRETGMREAPAAGGACGSDCYGLTARVTPVRVGVRAGPKAHVLVCAPSNSALDEIVLRVMNHGLMDGSGGVFSPNIVRVGVNAHHSVAGVALDTLVDARLGGLTDAGGRVPAVQRDRARSAILQEASIVFATLSFSGSSVLQRLGRHFDVVIIDEAAQAVEPSVLVPLVNGCKQVYLVGDPVQLPATVISSTAIEMGYDVSLFKRLQDAGYPVRVLDTQYRMHPAISAFPSLEFYGGRLKDSQGVGAETERPWHQRRCFGPFAFYDVDGAEAVPDGGASLVNKAEAEFVLGLYHAMSRVVPELMAPSASVAVISPYKAQVQMLRKLFKAALPEERARSVDINTIDGFQGREKDVVIFSAVRSSGQHNRSIGFVADERRINVGLTRARCSLLVVGNAASLVIDARWRHLVLQAAEREVLYVPTVPFAAYLGQVAAGTVRPSGISGKVRIQLDRVAEREERKAAEAALAAGDVQPMCAESELPAPAAVSSAASAKAASAQAGAAKTSGGKRKKGAK